MATFFVEKDLEGKKVPIPLVIEKAQQKSMEEIAGEIERARQAKLSGKDIVLHRKTSIIESFYYRHPTSEDGQYLWIEIKGVEIIEITDYH